MCKNATLIQSLKKKDNVPVEKVLKHIKGIVSIKRDFSGVAIWEGKELPFIETDEGACYYGIEGAKQYGDKELSLRHKG